MKYYYISREGPFRNNLVIGKDADRILRDKNKIIITRIKGRFHVLICRNGIFEKEKHILSYFELVEFLKKNTFNAYFVNVSSETAYYIHSYVKKDEKFMEDSSVTESPKSFFTLHDGNLLKVEAFVDRSIVKEKLDQVYQDETKDDADAQTVGLFDFVENSELFELYHYPFHEKNGKFTIPGYSYGKPSLFYMLSSLYNKEGEEINLTKDDLLILSLALVMNEEVARDIIGAIRTNILETYSFEQFNRSVDFVDYYKQRERDRQIELESMKSRLGEATKNAIFVNALGILDKDSEKGIPFKKTEERRDG